MQVRQPNPVESGHRIDDDLDRHAAGQFRLGLAQGLLGEFQVDLAPLDVGPDLQRPQRPLQLADIGIDPRRDEARHVVSDRKPVQLSLLVQDRHPRLEAGRLDHGHQPPLEPAHQTLLKVRDLLGQRVRRQDDLLVRLQQCVERVEELLLRPLTLGQKVDVVHHQHVQAPKLIAKTRHLPGLHSREKLRHEPLARGVVDLGVGCVLDDPQADRLEQMRLAQTDPAVNKQRVVGMARRCPHR